MSSQVDLPIEHASQAVDIDYLTRSKKTVGAVVNYSAELGGLDPKQIYLPMEMQKSVWSGIQGDTRGFPLRGEAAEFNQFSDLVKNDALLLWLCHQRGYDPRSLRPYRSALEAENERLHRELAEERKKNQIIADFMRQTK